MTALAFAAGLAATAAAPDVATATVTLLVAGAAGFAFTTLASTTIQLHTAPEYRGRIVALWVFVYIGTTPIGSVITGWLSGLGGPRLALLVGAASCVGAALIALRVKTPPHIDDTLLDLAPTRS
ncbi:MFS transporter [Actinoplanes sp. CA-054009]